MPTEKTISLSNLSRFKANYDTYVQGLIASAIASVYKPMGSKTVAQLNGTASSGNVSNPSVGDVYNVTDSGTLTAGSVDVNAGDNVVWTSDDIWDKLAGTVDLSGYLPLTAGSAKPLTGDLYTNHSVNFIEGQHTNCLLNFYVSAKRAGYISSKWDAFANKGTLQLWFDSYLKLTNDAGDSCTIDLSLLNNSRQYQVPDESGVFALRSDLSAQNIATYLGYTPYDGTTNPNGYITGISSTMISNALGYTPYSTNNPDGFISGITSSMVTTALGFTPLSPDDYASNSDIDALFA